MSDFETLKQSFYHRVACGPFEKPTHLLVGSDIVLHLPVLEFYASLCDHVTEFGVRDGNSTTALIAGCRGQVHSYDINPSPITPVLKDMTLPCSWTFHQADTVDPRLEIEETDMLFIDTLHTYSHLKQELAIHGRKARGFLAFHDTFTCGEFDLSGPDPKAKGIIPAIGEFIAQYLGEYDVVYSTKCNNGLIVLGRV